MTELRTVALSWTGNAPTPALDYVRSYRFDRMSDRDAFYAAALADACSGGQFQPELVDMHVVVTYARLNEHNIRGLYHQYGGPQTPDWIRFIRQVDRNASSHGIRFTYRGTPVQDDAFVTGGSDAQEQRALSQGGDTGPSRISGSSGTPKAFVATGNYTLADRTKRSYTISPSGEIATEALWDAISMAIRDRFLTTFDVNVDGSTVVVEYIGEEANDLRMQTEWSALQEQAIEAWKSLNRDVSELDFVPTPESVTSHQAA